MAAYRQKTDIAIYEVQTPNVIPNTMLWQRLLSEAKSQRGLSLSSSSAPRFHTPGYVNHLFLPLYLPAGFWADIRITPDSTYPSYRLCQPDMIF